MKSLFVCCAIRRGKLPLHFELIMQVPMSRPSYLKRAFTLAAILVLDAGISASSATSPVLPDASVIHMTADKQSYNLEQKKYSLTGRVNVSYQNMRITGSHADIEMDTSGKPQVARFTNRPLFKMIKPKVGEDTVTGDRINVYINDDRYAAQGSVQSHITTVAADPFYIRSDIQEFDHKNQVVSASGNVHVDYKGSKASSTLANVRMRDNGRAERVIFSGGAHIHKEASEINGEKITIMVDSGNLIAERNVHTRVDLPKQPATASTLGTTIASAAPKSTAATDPDRVFLSSDYQQYDKISDTILASGHVRIIYGDYVAVGPKATFKLKNKDLDRILLTGRATITETGRTITADRIVITTHPRNFDAAGNVKVNFKTTQGAATGARPATTGAKKAPVKPATGAKPTAAGTVKPATPSTKPLVKDDASDY
jgi:lipopolysaccharide export system protein LptA